MAHAAETLSAIIETAGDAIVTANSDGEIMSWNPAAERIFGYAEAEVVGRPLTLIIPERFRDPHHEGIGRVLATGETRIAGSTVEVAGLRKDGSEIPVELTLATWLADGDRWFSGIIRDVSERTELVSALNHSEGRLQAIVESANDAIITIDANGRVLLWNSHASKLFGYTDDEMIGRHLDAIIPERFRDIHRERQNRVSEGGEPGVIGHTIELGALHRDGHEFPIELSLAMWQRDEDRFFSGIIRDISVRKEAEEILRRAKERMEGELNVAADIQMSMLPLGSQVPDRNEFSVHAVLEPAREVGGDFYDFFLIDDDHLCFVVADVSDKGVPAALFMAVSKTLIRSHAVAELLPASILTAVNGELAENNESSMFVTIFLGILNIRTGELTYTNAGHNPPYIKSRTGGLTTLDQRHGPVAGAIHGLAYEQSMVQLRSGDFVIVFTDGVTEAMSAERVLYSEQRLESLLEKSSLANTEHAVSLIFDAVGMHAGTAEQSDDITILAVEFRGRPGDRSHQFDLTIANRMDEIPSVLAAFEEFAESSGLDDSVRRPLLVALDDLVNNIVSHGYPDGREAQIRISGEFRNDRLEVTLVDDGIPFNPFTASPPEVGTSIEDREIGGLGLHLVTSLMDERNYRRRSGRNVVSIVKRLAIDERGNADGNHQ